MKAVSLVVCVVAMVAVADGSQCGWGCGADSDCHDNPTCPFCIYGKCTAPHQCGVIPCNDSRACPFSVGKGYCSRCVVGGTPAPPPAPTPPPAPCEACAAGDVCCNPNASPPEMCPGNVACCQCGSGACKCPTAGLFPTPYVGNTSKGICGLGLPCGSPCILDGDCDQTGSCRSCGGQGACTHSD